jgi:hypothetical protein
LVPLDRRFAFPAALLLALGLLARAAAAEPAPGIVRVDPEHATEPGIYPTPLWAALQVIPSPEWQITSSGTHFGARWQVSPLLYSFGINRKLSPWRSFMRDRLRRGSSYLSRG